MLNQFLCYLLVLLFVMIGSAIHSQTAPNRYWVQFSDKENSPYSIQNPSEYLSARAIGKRKRFQINIEENDLPVNPQYINEVMNLGNIELIHQSKWFNAITIHLVDSNLLEQITLLPFVNEVKSVIQYSFLKEMPQTVNKSNSLAHPSEYGHAYPQIQLHNGQMLHELGYNGDDIHVAIFDAGFAYVNVLPVFERLRSENRIIETRDFTDNEDNVYTFSTHGRNVLSIMGGYQKDSLIGSAYEANYYLFVTEEVAYENIVEEDNWVAAAEYADSLGIDIINTSLGYNTFDDSTQNHSYNDLDGLTTRISIASNIAASKGIIPITSAGNSGNNSWHYITAPGDCIDCLTVGAVDTTGAFASFSSYGPAADGRVKPDVVSVGWQTAYAKSDSTITYGNGTSYSSPLLAGLTACLWQAFPEKNNFQIMDAVRKSAHLYQNPNDSLGYGIPNFWGAFQYLSEFSFQEDEKLINVFPSPFSEQFNILIEGIKPTDEISIQIHDMDGRLIYQDIPYLFRTEKEFVKQYSDELKTLSKGVYVLVVKINSENHSLKLIKQ